MRVWIDDDGCPRMVRDLVYTQALKRKIPLTVVANSYRQLPPHPLVTMKVVSSGFDAADDLIAEESLAGDLVITSDIPLAARLVQKGVFALTSRGDLLDQKNIDERLAIRNLMQELRSGGTIAGGPPPLNQQDKKRFADALDRMLTKLSVP